MAKPELVTEDEYNDELAERKGEIVGERLRDLADTGTAPLAAYAASRSELPMWARVGLGLVAVTKAPAFFRRVRRWVAKDE